RDRHASHEQDAATYRAPRSPHRTAGQAPAEYRAAAGRLRHSCLAAPPERPRAAAPGPAAPAQDHAVPLDALRMYRRRLDAKRWRMTLAAGVVADAGGLEASWAWPGVAVPYASARAHLPYSPRHHRQSTRSARCAPARASSAGGRSRGRDTGP